MPRRRTPARDGGCLYCRAPVGHGTSGPGPDGAAEISLEVSHEALIREWERLSTWLHDAREDIRRQQAISADAADWEQHARAADHLYRGSLLLEAEAWAARNTPSAREAAFIAAARAAQEQHLMEERERQMRQLSLAQQAAASDRRAANGCVRWPASWRSSLWSPRS